MRTRTELNRESAVRLLYQLARNRELHRERIASAGLESKHRLLRAWQAERLARTYADLLASPRYRPAAEFFLNELYGEKDFSRRDHDVERAYPIMVATMPVGVLRTVAMAVELNVLSFELDVNLLEILVKECDFKEPLSEAAYTHAYRLCDNYQQRVHQIELMGILGRELEVIVAKPLIHTALRLAKGPAYLAGFGELQRFIESGFFAFHRMGKAAEFLNAITLRETLILDRIYTGHVQPFATSGP